LKWTLKEKKGRKGNKERGDIGVSGMEQEKKGSPNAKM